MTKIYSNLLKLLTLCLLLFSSIYLKAQSTLNPGDIAFVGYNTIDDGGNTQDDEFSFILLKDIDANTEILFTDFGWTDQNSFQTADACGPNTGSYGDGVIRWRTNNVLTCGTQINIRCKTLLLANIGTVTGVLPTFNNNLNFINLNSANGDQIFAFQGSISAPTFISGISININWIASLDPCTFSSSRSVLPASLVGSSIAVFPNAVNAVYNCTITTGNSSSLLTELTNDLNWIKDTTSTLPISSTFSLPLTCSFSGCALPPPTILMASNDTTICENNTVSFSVNATNYDSLQWQVQIGSNWFNVLDTGSFSGTKDLTLIIGSPLFYLNGLRFRCVAYGQAPPNAISTFVILSVRIPPTITSFTPSRAACDGSNVSFNVNLLGNSNFYTYQWQIDTGAGFINLSNGGSYSGATSKTVLITSITPSMNQNFFRCIITGLCGIDTSTAVSLQVNVRPAVTLQPLDKTICQGSNTTFATDGIGSFISYQWQIESLGTFVNIVNNAVYSGAVNKVLTLTNPPSNLNGTRYRCLITGVCSPIAITDIVTLTIETIPTTPSVFVIDQTIICQKTDSVLYAIDPIPFASSYTWNYSGNDALLIASDTSAYINFGAQSTSGIISVFATNTCGIGSPLSTNITVNPTYEFNSTIDICPGDSANLDGVWYFSDTTITTPFTTLEGCDSIFNTTIKVAPIYNLQLTAYLCQGDSIFVGGNWQFNDGIFNDQFTTTLGCDSIIETTVITKPIFNEAQLLSICDNDSIFLGGGWVSTAGIYVDSLQSSFGCDSVVTTTLSINPVYLFLQTTSLCLGDSVFFNGNWISSGGLYTENYTTIFGCDSIYALDVIINQLPIVSLVLDTTICSINGPLTLFGESPSGGTWSGLGVTGNIFDPIGLAPGSYEISYSYSDINGCIASAIDTIIVTVCGGLNQNDITNFSLFPNPANEIITLQSKKDLAPNSVIEIYSIDGKRVFQSNNGTNKNQIPLNISTLDDGVYMLNIIQPSGKSSLRFTKQ